jgi:hypothetical protein
MKNIMLVELMGEEAHLITVFYRNPFLGHLITTTSLGLID